MKSTKIDKGKVMKKCLIILLMMMVMIRFTRQAIGDDRSDDREVRRDAVMVSTVMTSKRQQEEKRIKNTRNALEEKQVETEQVSDDVKKAKADIKNVKIEKIKEEVKTKEAAPRKTARSFYRFGKIELAGNKVFSYKKLKKKVFGKFIGKPFNLTNIKALQKELSDYYISKGYTKIKVWFDQKQIIKIVENKEGGETTFTYIIEEGKIGDIKLEVNKKAGDIKLDVNEKATKSKSVSTVSDFRKKMQVFFAFPLMKQKVFNKKAIDQGVSQMNRLRSNNIRIKEDKPKDKSLGGLYTDITVINNQDADNAGVNTGSRTTFFDLSCDNSGSKSTGQEVIGLNISQDNLLSVNDNICIKYTETADSLLNIAKKDSGISYGKCHRYGMLDLFNNDDDRKRFNKSLSGEISIPLGYWTFKTSMSYSKYKECHIIDKTKTTGRAAQEEYFTTGKTESKGYDIDRVLYKGDKYKLNAGTRLKIKDKESYRGEEKNNGGGEGRTSNGSIYINNTIYTKNGTLTIKPTYQRGLNLFGSRNDKDSHKEKSKKDRDEKFEYGLINLYLCFNTKVDIPLLSMDKELKRKRLPLQYTMAVNSQYSFDNLYGSNQIGIGGQGTVRGFRESQISGDNGVYIRNDVGVKMLELVPEKLWEAKVMEQERNYLFKESPKTILSKTKLGIFYDIGYVKKYKQIDENGFNDRYMMGTGVLLSYSGKYVNSTLTYSKSLHNPLKEKEKQAIYWEIGISW